MLKPEAVQLWLDMGNVYKVNSKSGKDSNLSFLPFLEIILTLQLGVSFSDQLNPVFVGTLSMQKKAITKLVNTMYHKLLEHRL